MKRLVLLTGILLLAFSGFVNAQPFNWQYVEDFMEANQPHGIVVDPDGKIWVGSFGYTDTLGLPNDTVRVARCDILNPDGSPASFSPILTITVGGLSDSLDGCRGMSLDNNGNIMYSDDVTSGKPSALFRINYQTGEGMNKVVPDVGASVTEAAVDANGFIYITGVVPAGAPIKIYQPDFTLYNFALDSTSVISRTLVVSPDGNDLYHGAIYPPAGIIHYHSDVGPNGLYTTVDTLLGPDPTLELWGQILDWGPLGNIWVGSYWDVTGPAYKGWYAIDPATNNVFQDSIGHNIFQVDTNYVAGDIPAGATFAAPRGIAFWEENDGSWTAYTADFDGHVVKKWTNPGLTGIIVVDNGEALISEFELRQNYPNPFNPATSIPFRLRRAADVKLVIYNVNGQVVETLVNERLQAGSYEYEFNASDMASGTYFYRITVDAQTLTKRMMLLK